MPNYYSTGRTPLNMQCPHCGEYNEHRTIRTYPGHYKWSDEATSLFIDISGKDLSFRQRTKRCSKCNRSFIAVEMAKNYLNDLINTLIRYKKRIDEIEGEKLEYNNELLSLREKINKIRKISMLVK